MSIQTVEQIKVIDKANEPRINEKVYTFSKIDNTRVKIRKAEKKTGTKSRHISAEVPKPVEKELEEKGFEVVA